MWKKLKRTWFYNRKEIKLGLGSLLSFGGLLILVASFPAWIFQSLVGGVVLGGGVKLLLEL